MEILDYEQLDNMSEIFKLSDALKERTVYHTHLAPYCLGWIQMLVFCIARCFRVYCAASHRALPRKRMRNAKNRH